MSENNCQCEPRLVPVRPFTWREIMAEEKPATVAGAPKSDAELRRTLTPEQYRVTQQHGTERPFTHPYNTEKRDGTFACVVCGEPLFNSQAKFDSGSGWPSFYQPASDAVVSEVEDFSHLMRRTEVRCARCQAHLGHVFPDGPQPTGQRYCINGAALKFEKKD
jgi:peptide-methionine (R)-S-oxide reductase